MVWNLKSALALLPVMATSAKTTSVANRTVQPALKFVPISAARIPACVWAAVVDQKRFFTIARYNHFFVAHVSWLNGSHKRRIGRNFKTFDAAVRASVLMLESSDA
jgi:hypothetical protein